MPSKMHWIVTMAMSLVIHFSAQGQNGNKYRALFSSPPTGLPTSKVPDAPMAGNGDIGLTLGGPPEKLTFYIGKNDFWRAYPVYPGGGIASPGGLSIQIDALKDATYQAAEVLENGTIEGTFTKDGLNVRLTTWVSATSNMVVAKFISNKPTIINLNLWATKGNTSVTDKGQKEGVQWVSRSFENTPLLKWPSHISMAMKVVGSSIDNHNNVQLPGGKAVFVTLSIQTNFDHNNWKAYSIEEAKALTSASISHLYDAHKRWWAKFWSKSGIHIQDSTLEKYYYFSQYLFASSSAKDKFAPGIWGPFITKDSAAWGGDYHLNYNYQAPYWASYSSNHIEQTDNFDQPLLDFMPEGRKFAKDLLGLSGIYYPVGIGPKGLCTTRWPLTPDAMKKRYGTRENKIDSGYKFLGQKINAVYSVGNMLMRYYSTYDLSYAQRIYPYLLACADFWEDYMTFEDGYYVIKNDHFNEVMPNLKNKGQWKNRLGDINSSLSLGLVKMLFKGMTDISNFLHKDSGRQKKWAFIAHHIHPFPTGENNGRVSLKNVERNWQGDARATGLNRVSIHGLILPGSVCGPVSTPKLNKILLEDISHWKDDITNPEDWGNTKGNGLSTCFPGAVRVGYNSDSILYYLKSRIKGQSARNLWITQGGGGIETLAAVPLTINEMLLQSYEGIVRVFPNWNLQKEASFEHLRAYGAFLVSSHVNNGVIRFVRIESEKGRPCLMENPWSGNTVQLYRNGKKAEQLKGSQFSFLTSENEIIEIKRLK